MMIRMVRAHRGSKDGIHLEDFSTGEVYDVPERLAVIFVEQIGCAERFSPSQEALPVFPVQHREHSMLPGAPENKVPGVSAGENLQGPRRRGRPPGKEK